MPLEISIPSGAAGAGVHHLEKSSASAIGSEGFVSQGEESFRRSPARTEAVRTWPEAASHEKRAVRPAGR